MKKSIIYYLRCLVIVFTLSCTFPVSIGWGAQPKVSVQLESQEVYLGESFAFQIVLNDEETPISPEIPATHDFKIESRGVSNSSSSNVTIINGRMQQNVSYRYIFNYSLTANKSGVLTIPSFNVQTSDGIVATNPIQIKVLQPQADENFVLRQELSKTNCFVGEPVTLTVTWYLAANAEEFSFSLPILDDDRFIVKPLPVDPKPKNEYNRFSLAGHDVLLHKGIKNYHGQNYTTVSFKEVVIPKESGEFKLDNTVVSGKKVVGYRRNKNNRSLFSMDPFFEDFFDGGHPVLKSFAIPSNSLTLKVEDVPKADKPYDYTGLVGDYSIIANATPTEVNVGDPITLTIEVAGPEYMGNVKLYPLEKQPDLKKSFKIPSEISAPTIDTNIATFTQTLRPLTADVKAIPPIRFSYFDSTKKSYFTAKTDAIPLKVSSARVVTAADAEGITPIELPKTNIQKLDEGIVYNYTNTADLLKKQDIRQHISDSPFWMAILIIPFGLYLILLLLRICRYLINKNSTNNSTLKLHDLQHLCNEKAAAPQLLVALRTYLTTKLNTTTNLSAYSDLEPLLQARKVSKTLQQEIRQLLEELEAASYAGEQHTSLHNDVKNVLKKFEKEVK